MLAELDDADVWAVLSNTRLVRQVEIFEFLSVSRQVELVDAIGRERLGRLIGEMSSDDRVDLLGRLPPERVEGLMPLLAQAERADVRKLLAFEPHTAGAIMTTEYASLPEDVTVGEAIDRLRKQAPDSETIYYIYVVDADRRLDGFVSLRDLILAKPHRKLGDIMRREVISVRADDDQEEVAEQVARYDFLAIPVTDEAGHLVGIVTHDDAMDILREEAEEDVLMLGAVEPLTDSYSESTRPGAGVEAGQVADLPVAGRPGHRAGAPAVRIGLGKVHLDRAVPPVGVGERGERRVAVGGAHHPGAGDRRPRQKLRQAGRAGTDRRRHPGPASSRRSASWPATCGST